MNRKLLENGDYDHPDNMPINYAGRTGIIGRGKLLYWGVNHAADFIGTRWIYKEDGKTIKTDEHGK